MAGIYLDLENTNNIDIGKLIVENFDDTAFALSKLSDELFLYRITQVLDINPTLNKAFFDMLDTKMYIDLPKSVNVVYDSRNSAITIGDSASSGILYTKEINLQTIGETNEYVVILAGSNIDKCTVDISNDGINFYRIVNRYKPIVLPTKGRSIWLKIGLNKDITGNPVVTAFAVLTYDEEAALQPVDDNIPDTDVSVGVISHKQLIDVGPDDHHPKIHKHSGLPGENDKIDLQHEVKGILGIEHLPYNIEVALGDDNVLYRNEAGKLVKVIGTTEKTYLLYEGDKLIQSITVTPTRIEVTTLKYDNDQITGTKSNVLENTIENLNLIFKGNIPVELM